ncbi:MAG: hypothetical protein WDZ64_00965 [Parcubacteria group bacterium]
MKYHQTPSAVVNRDFFVTRAVLLSSTVLVVLGFILAFDIKSAEAVDARPVSSDFRYTFNSEGVLLETGSMGESSSPYFWLNSGGKFIIKDGIGQTISGKLSSSDPFRVLYERSNSLDTEDGYRPQNIFRFLTRSEWGNAEQEMSFRITAQNFANSPNRDGHNGVLLINRYQDSNNLYYAGIRNDGQAVIKKKINGTYHTLATVQIFGVKGKYNRNSLPTLLPYSAWMRMKTQVINQSDGSVYIRLLIDRENDGSFVSILSARDHGTGGTPLREDGYAGIRTDFMDVEFGKYNIKAF